MKKQKAKKIRKVWGIKPKSRIQTSSKRALLDKTIQKALRRRDLDAS
jgi:hypothetical protein